MRPIDADALREDLRGFFPVEVLEGIEPKTLFAQIMHDIDSAPTVAYPFEKFRTMLCGTCQAHMRIEPERQGEWGPCYENYKNGMFYRDCSICGKATITGDWKFCPYCGAAMRDDWEGTND